MKHFILLISIILSLNAFPANALQDATSSQVELNASSQPSQVECSEVAEEINLAFGVKSPNTQDLSAKCCKICRKGKACGDSCIARSKTCNKGKGCACDG